MYVCETSFRDLNFNFYPPHLISIYIYEVTTNYHIKDIGNKN